jgi:hypothetical protein
MRVLGGNVKCGVADSAVEARKILDHDHLVVDLLVARRLFAGSVGRNEDVFS